MSILSTAVTATKNHSKYVAEIREVMSSDNRAEALDKLVQKQEEKQAEVVSAAIQEVVNNITSSVNEALKDLEPKEAEAIKRVSQQLVEYLLGCLENGVAPTMVTTAFENISEETIKKMFMDPQFDIVDYMNNPDKYLKEVREEEETAVNEEAAQEITNETLETVEEQAEEIVETLKAALNPVNPIIKSTTPDGKVELDLSKVGLNIGAQEPLRGTTEAPKAKENKKDKKKEKKSNPSEEHHEECTDESCACHGDGINWPGNIGAYFDTTSLFMVKNKETKKEIGERIARAFDNFDTLQELSQYLGDAPELPFGFKLVGVRNKNEFDLAAERTINGRYTKLTFSFFEGGATITAA